MKIFLIALLGVFGLPFATHASELALNKFFDEVITLRADFTQRIEDEQGTLLESTRGRFYLSRPGKFRWDYANPDFVDEPGQQIVADGKHLFFYDPDLEQVSRRSLDSALGQVPSLLLAQRGGDIAQHFTMTDFGISDGLSWVSLKPKDADASYRELMIGFDNDTIAALRLHDGLGNSTRLSLINVDTSVDIPDAKFQFIVPDGADVLDQ